jgi:glycosyltransferase involved in cell wall biosynthesis
MKPRLLVDATAVGPEPTGIGTYTIGMVAALERSERFEITVVARQSADGRWGATRVIDAPAYTGDFLRRLAWREANLSRVVERERAAILLAPLPELPVQRLGCASVVVVHDVSILVAPSLFTRSRWVRQAMDLGRVCRRATRVVCVSETTRLQLFGVVRIHRDKLAVVGEGPGQFTGTRDGDGDGDRGRDLRSVLWVGQAVRSRRSLYLHKNLEALLGAVGRDPDVASPLRLLIAGPLAADHRRVFDDLVRGCHAEGRVQHLGYVSRERLDALYRSVGAVAFPSLAEGFGLPVLEALSRGAPVVASDIPAIREVAGDAAHFVRSPLDSDAWREAIEAVLHADGPRTELMARGRARARSHTWERAGARMSEELAAALD